MTKKRGMLTIAAGVIVCATVVWLSALIRGEEMTYEVRPEVAIPEYKTDAARAIEAFERTMNRYMTLTERTMTGVNLDLRAALRKLDSVEQKLGSLSVRIARIERALGIEEPNRPVEDIARAETSDKPASESANTPRR